MGKEGEEAEEVGVLIAVEAVGSRAALRDADELSVTLLCRCESVRNSSSSSSSSNTGLSPA